MLGYIKYYRCSTDDPLYFAERFTKWQAFSDLLLLVTHKESIIVIKGHIIRLKAGELCWSQVKLAERWKWNPKTVKKFLKLLVEEGKIAFSGDNTTTIIKIKNWDRYQGKTDNYTVRNGEQGGEQESLEFERDSQKKNLYEEDYGEQNTELNGERHTELKVSGLRTNNNDENVKMNNDLSSEAPSDSFQRGNKQRKRRGADNELDIKNLPADTECIFFTGEKFFVTKAFRDELLHRFSAVMISEEALSYELRRMDDYLRDRNKTQANYKQFIRNWISRTDPRNPSSWKNSVCSGVRNNKTNAILTIPDFDLWTQTDLNN